MTTFNSLHTYGNFNADKLLFSDLDSNKDSLSFAVDISGADPAIMLINLEQTSHSATLVCKSADGSADIDIALESGGVNVVFLDSGRIKKNDGTAEFTITTTADSLRDITAGFALVCHAKVKNN